MTDRSAELAVADLKRLGRYYQNDLLLEVECEDGVVRIVPPRSTWLPLAVMTGIIATVYGGFVYLIIFVPGVYDEPLLWAFLGLIGVLAIGGPVIAHRWRLAYLESVSPLVEFRAAEQEIRILAGEQTFPVSDVYALLGLAMADSDGEVNSELQLITYDGEQLTPHLICTSLFASSRQVFGEVLRKFGRHSGVRTIIAEPKGFLQRGEIVISDLVERNEGSADVPRHAG